MRYSGSVASLPKLWKPMNVFQPGSSSSLPLTNEPAAVVGEDGAVADPHELVLRGVVAQRRLQLDGLRDALRLDRRVAVRRDAERRELLVEREELGALDQRVALGGGRLRRVGRDRDVALRERRQALLRADVDGAGGVVAEQQHELARRVARGRRLVLLAVLGRLERVDLDRLDRRRLVDHVAGRVVREGDLDRVDDRARSGRRAGRPCPGSGTSAAASSGAGAGRRRRSRAVAATRIGSATQWCRLASTYAAQIASAFVTDEQDDLDHQPRRAREGGDRARDSPRLERRVRRCGGRGGCRAHGMLGREDSGRPCGRPLILRRN